MKNFDKRNWMYLNKTPTVMRFFLLSVAICCINFLGLTQSEKFSPKKKDGQLVLDTVDLECIYKLEYDKDTAFLNDDYVFVEDFVLQIGKSGVSKFESYNWIYDDSIKQDLHRRVISGDILQIDVGKYPQPNLYYRIFKHFPDKKITVIDKVWINHYEYVENLELFDWKIKDETREIAGFYCQKATTECFGRIWEAWFTYEIPVSDGPYKFHGLPGIIVKVHDTEDHYDFKLKSITRLENNTSRVIIFENKNAIKCTKKEVFWEKKKLQDDPIGYRPGVSFNSPETEKIVVEGYKNENNPLELEFWY